VTYCASSLAQRVIPDSYLTRPTTGNKIAINITMIPIVTSNSIKVNARRFFMLGSPPHGILAPVHCIHCARN
jgi:hypothetical protein